MHCFKPHLHPGRGCREARTPRFSARAGIHVFEQVGIEYQDVAGSTRRKALAEWIANPANPYTARALGNRYWGWLMGRGLK